MQDHDVIIAGLGPVGAALAALLVGEGLSVAVVERHQDVFDKPRAIVLDHEALRIFQHCRIDPAFFDGLSPHPGTDFLGADGGLIKLFDPAPPPYALGWPATVTFIQPELEAALRRRLAEDPRACFGLGEEIVAVAQEGRGATLETVNVASGARRQWRGKYVIGCDGANSLVRQAIGSTLENLDFSEYWLVIDAWLVGEADLPRKVTQYCRPERPGTFVLGPKNLRRWEIKLLPGETPQDFDDPAVVRAVLSRFVDVSALEIWRSAVYRFGARVADRWRDGHVLIAGDAAHQTPPFLGQGLCAGLRDAANLAWKLVQVEKFGADPQLLDLYQTERAAHCRTVIAHAKDFGLIIGELDVEKARRRDAELREELASGAMKTVRQAFIPDLATGLIDAAAPGAGALFIQPEILDAAGARQKLEDLLSPRFLVVAADPAAFGALDPELRRNFSAIGGEILCLATGGIMDDRSLFVEPDGVFHIEPDGAFLVEPDGASAQWLAGLGAVAAIIRPDRHVYGAACDAEALARQLRGLVERLSPAAAPSA